VAWPQKVGKQEKLNIKTITSLSWGRTLLTGKLTLPETIFEGNKKGKVIPGTGRGGP
jgi:hypothetical protein